MKELSLDARNVTMIGDSRHSDYVMAKRNGLEAKLLRHGEEKTGKDLSVRKKYGANCLKMRALAERNKDRQLVNFAFPLYLMTKRLAEELEERQIKDILFFSREGKFFRRLFEIYREERGKCPNVRTHYFMASRNSMMTASLYPLEREDFACVVKNTYMNMLSANTFLLSLGFEKEQIAYLQSRFQFSFRKTYLRFYATKQYKSLLNDAEFQRIYEELRTSRAEAFGAYLDGFHIDYRNDGLCVFDVGWKGLIQDLLHKYVGQDVKMHGFYLGLHETKESDLYNKTGLLCSKKNKKYPRSHYFQRYKMLYEQICRADHGHPERYELREDGTCGVVLDTEHRDKELFDELFAPLQDRIAQTFREICKLDYDKFSQIENTVVRVRYYSVTHMTKSDYRWQLDAEDCHYDSFCRVGYRLALVSRGTRTFTYKFMDALFALKYFFARGMGTVRYSSSGTYRK